MRPEQAAFWGAIVGGTFTLAGTLLTGVITIVAQWRQAVFLQSAERKKQVFERRLVAIQNAVKLIDFLIASRNAYLGEGGHNLWISIRAENIANGALFPLELSSDFAPIIQKIFLVDSLHESEKHIDYDALRNFREKCLLFINNHYG
jgi:hypothetical protein